METHPKRSESESPLTNASGQEPGIDNLRAEEIALKREELGIERRNSAKTTWSSPLVVALIGLLATVLAGMLQNYLQSKAARELERQRFEAALIQKAVETADASDAVRRLQWLVDLGFIKDEKGKIAKLVGDPENIPLQPITAPRSDEPFIGVTRREAKLSIGTGPIENFHDVKDLIASLPTENAMKSRKDVTSRESPRLAEEQRNVKLSAFLYFAKRQVSNDYFLILGCEPKTQPELYMIAVVAGLPESDAPAYEHLKSVRDDLVQGVKQKISGRYAQFEPPIPIDVEGSLYFDASHGMIGPTELHGKIPTRWQIRPVTKLLIRP